LSAFYYYVQAERAVEAAAENSGEPERDSVAKEFASVRQERYSGKKEYYSASQECYSVMPEYYSVNAEGFSAIGEQSSAGSGGDPAELEQSAGSDEQWAAVPTGSTIGAARSAGAELRW